MLAMGFYAFILILLIYWVETSTGFLPNSLKTKTSPAEELETWLKRFNWTNRQEPAANGKLPVYKFYTEVIELLLNLSRKMGGSYQDSVLFLREGLQTDRQFEKKLKEMIMGTWLQMGLMMLLTWLFIFAALALVEVKIGVLKLAGIGLWQCFGLGCLPLLLNHFRHKYFAHIGELWKMLYILRSLSRVPLSRTEVMAVAGVTKLKNISQKSLEPIVEKLKETCQRALQQGGSYEEEIVSQMGELRFQEKWHFELFEKRLMVIKLGLLAIFFLPSYLAFIFLLLGDLMTLM